MDILDSDRDGLLRDVVSSNFDNLDRPDLACQLSRDRVHKVSVKLRPFDDVRRLLWQLGFGGLLNARLLF